MVSRGEIISLLDDNRDSELQSDGGDRTEEQSSNCLIEKEVL